ncbi:hypothetical protein JOQ06_018300, partial [Pogonophryne albipinna]
SPRCLRGSPQIVQVGYRATQRSLGLLAAVKTNSVEILIENSLKRTRSMGLKNSSEKTTSSRSTLGGIRNEPLLHGLTAETHSGLDYLDGSKPK